MPRRLALCGAVGLWGDRVSLIRAWREYKGLRQRDVAERLGISQSAYSQIENSDSEPRAATRQRVAAALGVLVLALSFVD